MSACPGAAGGERGGTGAVEGTDGEDVVQRGGEQRGVGGRSAVRGRVRLAVVPGRRDHDHARRELGDGPLQDERCPAVVGRHAHRQVEHGDPGVLVVGEQVGEVPQRHRPPLVAGPARHAPQRRPHVQHRRRRVAADDAGDERGVPLPPQPLAPVVLDRPDQRVGVGEVAPGQLPVRGQHGVEQPDGDARQRLVRLGERGHRPGGRDGRPVESVGVGLELDAAQRAVLAERRHPARVAVRGPQAQLGEHAVEVAVDLRFGAVVVGPPAGRERAARLGRVRQRHEREPQPGVLRRHPHTGAELPADEVQVLRRDDDLALALVRSHPTHLRVAGPPHRNPCEEERPAYRLIHG